MISFVFYPRVFEYGCDKRFSLWQTTVLALVAGCSFVYPVCAEDSDTLEVHEVVVAATKIPMAPSRLSAATTVLTQHDIGRTPFRSGTQIDDLLRYVPTVQPSLLSSRYNHPTAQFVSIRGLGTRRALVLLDGVPLNDGFGGWINWGLIPDRVERVEIIPGGGSNLYGTWAMGGIINIITQSGRPKSGASSEVSGGSLGTTIQSVRAQYGNDRTGFTLSYRHFDTAGFLTVPSYQRGQADVPVGSEHHQFMGKLIYELTPTTTATVSGTYYTEDRSFGTPFSQGTRTIGTVSLGVKGNRGAWGIFETKAFAQWQTFRNQSGAVQPSPFVRLFDQLDRLQIIPSNDVGGMAQWTVPVLSFSRIVAGADARAILAQSEDRFVPSQLSLVTSGKQLGLGTFGEWIIEPFNTLVFTAAVRWDWWRNFDGTKTTPSGLVTHMQDNTASLINPKVSLLYKVNERVRIGASVYQAFRAPTLNELYRDFGSSGFTFLSNDRLEPERLTGGDVKVEVDVLPRGLLGFRATGHYDVIKDQILFVTQGPTSAMRQNIAEGRSVGTDIELHSRVDDLLSLTVGYSFVDSVITRFPGNPSREGLRIPNVSSHQVTAALTIGRPDVAQLTLQTRYLSRQFADDTNRQPIADFVVLDASLRKRITSWGELFIDGENLTDRRYIATQTGGLKILGQPLLILGGLRIDL
ncbi:MAG TPA: TonB-dependent receptor [Nitrospira sp.]|nr:TonB-dependent receptor [Nitrospira sp.]